MILAAAKRAFANLLAPETRSAFWKVLGLTLLVLVGLWFALRGLFASFVMPWVDSFMPGVPEWAGWLSVVVSIFAGLGLALMLAFLLSPVTALIAGLFLDDVAEVIEKRDYPLEPPGRAMPLVEGIIGSLKFLGVVIVGNLLALLLLFVPGVNLVAFFIVNGAIALGLALAASDAAWSLYTGVIAYMAMGILFGVEYLVRLRFKRLHHA